MLASKHCIHVPNSWNCVEISREPPKPKFVAIYKNGVSLWFGFFAK